MQSGEQRSEKKFALLKPVQSQPRLQSISLYPSYTPPSSLSHIFDRPTAMKGEPMALDFETKGFPSSPDSYVVGVGLSDSRGSYYVCLKGEAGQALYQFIIAELNRTRIPLLAHNLNFDATWVVRDHGVQLNWLACTYATYRHLATEGWPGQKWGLKDAQVELLGWEAKGDEGLDRWLVENGYGSAVTDSKTGQVKLRPEKGEMHRAPLEVLGHYCALDADSTWQLWTQVLAPTARRFKALWIHLTVHHPKYQLLLIKQTLSGIRIDLLRLAAYAEENGKALWAAKLAILDQPLISNHLLRLKQEALAELQASRPAEFLKAKQRPPEPPAQTKAGLPSKAHAAWVANQDKYRTDIVSKNYLRWLEKFEACKASEPGEHFNLNSYPAKKRLFYSELFPASHLTSIKRQQGSREVEEACFRLVTPERTVLLPLTKSDGVPINRVALKQMGAVGKVFLDYQELVKEQQFIEALKENHVQGILHPQFRVPGTLTGRLSGGGGRSNKNADGTKSRGFNIQQIPKSPGFLRCFVPREGKTFVDVDHTALEQVVLAELSKDPALWRLYGPDAKPNDVYLFTGSNLPGLGDRIRACGYNPDDPTAEGIKSAKEGAKRERGIAKIVTLGASYKMGPAKLQRTLSLEGTEVSFEEAQAIHRGYWSTYAGVKLYEREHLLPQFEDNDGWVLNGIGRPIGIFEDYKSDIVNRVVQSTGHDVHVLFALIVDEVLKTAGIQFNWTIVDFHDQSIVEVALSDASRVKDLLNGECYARLNQKLKGAIPLKGDAQIVKDLSYAKVSKEDIKLYLRDLGIIEEDEDE